MATAVTKRVFPASTAVPWVYRIILTTIEPLFALRGAWLVFQAPSEYLATMTRDAVTYKTPTTFLYTSIGGGWLYFAFVSAVVLRTFDDVRLWRYLCMGMLLSDIAFCHATAQAVGGWVAWSKVSEWTMDDHAIFLANGPVLLVRILLILGVGVKTNSGCLKTQ